MEPMKLGKLGKKVDRISDLPDVLLHHIFSSIDMKHAVQASLLSKRWRNFWKSLPTLKFWHNGGHMNDFVDRVLMIRGRSIIIQRFDLVSVSYDIASRLDRWIHEAMVHNVKEVSIKFYRYADIDIPPDLFTCKSLTKLELKHLPSPYLKQEIILPDSVTLPRLKTLDLCWFRFHDELLTNQFFSSCPELESLVIQNCDFWLINLHISCPKLKHMKLESCVLEIKTVKLNAPNLLSFCFGDHLSPVFLKVQDCDSAADECPDLKFPSQFKLRHLKFVKIKYSRCNDEVEFLKFLLKNAEVLEKMTVSIPSSSQTRSHDFREGLLGFPRAAPNAILSVC